MPRQPLDYPAKTECVAETRHIQETIDRLVTAAIYGNEETVAHLTRMAHFSQVLADAAGWPSERVDQIGMAASLHDIGKIGVPDTILWKPGRLSRQEVEVIKMHTVFGAAMLESAGSAVLQMAQEIALNHHEHWDGGGYPHGRAGSAIPAAARITAILDTYDALTHDRVYRSALSHDEVLSILGKCRQTRFDPELLDLFFAVLPEIRRISEQFPDTPGEQDGIRRFFVPAACMEPAVLA